LSSAVQFSRITLPQVSKPKTRCESVALFRRLYHRFGECTGWEGFPFSCIAGSNSEAYLNATADQINYYRLMVGLPTIALDEYYNAKDQQAAVMMATTGTLSHFPDRSFSCYTSDGAEAASMSNLALGALGPGAIDLYIFEFGSNNAPVGHRRWLLYPPQQIMGTGSVGRGSDFFDSYAANATWVMGVWGPRPATPEWVAWPPDGYVPVGVIPERWSFSYPSADFSEATVVVARDGQSRPLALEPIDDGYGDNTIVWLMEYYSRDEVPVTLTVSIRNVVIHRRARDFTYDVTIIDPDDPGAGDCDGSGSVTVDEIITLVQVALGNKHVSDCTNGLPAYATDADVDVTLIIQAVDSALNTCSGT
jgi:hypothetical protein